MDQHTSYHRPGVPTQCDEQTRSGICDRPTDSRGYCDRPRDHVDLDDLTTEED